MKCLNTIYNPLKKVNVRQSTKGNLIYEVPTVIFIVSIALIACCSCSARHASVRTKPYNIIIVTFDAMGARFLDLYGFQKETAPNLRAYAGECHVFTDAISQSGSTSYSLGSLFSSLYPFTDDLITPDRDNLSIKRNRLYLPYLVYDFLEPVFHKVVEAVYLELVEAYFICE